MDRKPVVLSDIVERRSSGNVRFRVLSCGHTQQEPSGGKAAQATRARCFTCFPRREKPSPPGETPEAPPVETPPAVCVIDTKTAGRVRCLRPLRHLESQVFVCPRCGHAVCGTCESIDRDGVICDSCWVTQSGVV
jgi:hypothetical protein